MEFIKYNNNPKNKKTGDCVIRAIATATNSSWEYVYSKLSELGIEQGLMINDSKNWQKYLENLGYIKQKMPRRSDRTRYTLEEFATELAEENKIYLVKLAGHLTVIKNKKLIDTWNCSYKSVGNYWVAGGTKNDN